MVTQFRVTRVTPTRAPRLNLDDCAQFTSSLTERFPVHGSYDALVFGVSVCGVCPCSRSPPLARSRRDNSLYAPSRSETQIEITATGFRCWFTWDGYCAIDTSLVLVSKYEYEQVQFIAVFKVFYRPVCGSPIQNSQ